MLYSNLTFCNSEEKTTYFNLYYYVKNMFVDVKKIKLCNFLSNFLQLKSFFKLNNLNHNIT